MEVRQGQAVFDTLRRSVLLDSSLSFAKKTDLLDSIVMKRIEKAHTWGMYLELAYRNVDSTCGAEHEL